MLSSHCVVHIAQIPSLDGILSILGWWLVSQVPASSPSKQLPAYGYPQRRPAFPRIKPSLDLICPPHANMHAQLPAVVCPASNGTIHSIGRSQQAIARRALWLMEARARRGTRDIDASKVRARRNGAQILFRDQLVQLVRRHSRPVRHTIPSSSRTGLPQRLCIDLRKRFDGPDQGATEDFRLADEECWDACCDSHVDA